jgi:hypothetical protein
MDIARRIAVDRIRNREIPLRAVDDLPFRQHLMVQSWSFR